VRAEQVLIERERLMSAAVQGMLDGVMLVNMAGRLIYMNRACEKLLGYKAKNLIGKSAFELPTYSKSKDREMAKRVLEKVISGVVVEPVDMNVVGKDGNEVPVSFTASVIRDAQGNPETLVAVIRDVTERKRAEEALRASEEHYSALVGSITDAVFKFKNGVITWCNEAVLDIYGYASQELVGKDVSVLQPLDISPSAFDKKITIAIRKRGCFCDVTRVRKKDNSIVDIEYTVSKVKHARGKRSVELVAVAHDISERKRMEEAIKESEELARGMLDTAATGIYLLQDGRFEYVNRLFEQISGYSSDELKGVYSIEYVHPEDREMVRAKAIDTLKGQSSLPYEYRLTGKDSKIIWVLDRLTTIQYRGKRSVLGTIMDITERKSIETEVLDYTRQLETLFNVGTVVNQTLNLNELLDSVLDRVLKVMDVEAGGIFLLDKESGELNLMSYRGVSEEFVKKVEGLRIGEGFTGKAALSKKPFIVEDIDSDSRLTRMGVKEEGLQLFAAVPVVAKDRMLGVIGVGSYQPRKFGDRELRLLNIIASQIGMAVENAQLYEQALELAFTDGLTGLYNRRYLMEQIEREFSRVERSGGFISLMMIDLDGLKIINDRFGHHEGDVVLKGLASIIRSQTRASDIAARWGGDEFMLLTVNSTGKGTRQISERIRSQVEKYRRKIEGVEVTITISIGIASYPGHASDVTQLLQRVDEAMYCAKRGGGNQLCVFSS
jgi:diguanylate cyclase (GGDEF)-like protein/PAS domain S-box-containing protein